MKICYFQDPDTLYIEFKQSAGAETEALDENLILDLDPDGGIVSITIEQASQRTDVSRMEMSGFPQ